MAALILAGGAAADTHAAEAAMTVADLPTGAAPPALEFRHFPSRFHAFVWRNWELVSAERMAAVAGTEAKEIERTGRAMGLSGAPGMGEKNQKRAAITIIRRNWHLLPYDQLLRLLEWSPEQMAFSLREDDFLFIKLGSLKPHCEPLRYEPATESTRNREDQIAATVRKLFSEGAGGSAECLFAFVDDLSEPTSASARLQPASGLNSADAPRICYSYFGLYGDPLLEEEADPYPDALLARLAETGVNGVWMQGMLNRMAPFPWDPSVSQDWEIRMERLRVLVARARRYGIGIYLYLNEPRAMSHAFYEKYPHLKGVAEGDFAALCTSSPEVQAWLANAVASICREVPDLAGFFTISGSENLTNCWSHHRGGDCPRCGPDGAARVIAELHGKIQEGIRRSGTEARLIAWDWGWSSDWVEGIASGLARSGNVAGTEKSPTSGTAPITLMSVSEWEVPIRRGGVETSVGEYSISAVGPGPRARRHWALAQKQGLPIMAKIQAGNTWELSAVPYIPVGDTIARHCAALRESGVRGMLLGWTLGGYPSPNLEIATLISRTSMTAEEAQAEVARRRFGETLAPKVTAAWKEFSTAFGEFPFHVGVVYNAPLQMGPANLLWSHPTGYRATMVGIPYDDLNSWRAVYPAEVFAGQLAKVADGFEAASERLSRELLNAPSAAAEPEREAVRRELGLAEAAAIHFRSAANQAKFVTLRTRLEDPVSSASRSKDLATLSQLLTSELQLACRLKRLQEQDSRIGFEASNQYFYTPLDLAEKALNCTDLLENWLPRMGRPTGSEGR